MRTMAEKLEIGVCCVCNIVRSKLWLRSYKLNCCHFLNKAMKENGSQNLWIKKVLFIDEPFHNSWNHRQMFKKKQKKSAAAKIITRSHFIGRNVKINATNSFATYWIIRRRLIYTAAELGSGTVFWLLGMFGHQTRHISTQWTTWCSSFQSRK